LLYIDDIVLTASITALL
jgi:hypothetical protein